MTRDYDPATMITKQLNIADSWIDRFEDAARQAFEQDRREVLALVSDNQREALRLKAMPNWISLQREIADYFRDASRETWQDIFAPQIQGVMGEAGDEWAAILGVQFDVRNLEGEAWFQQYLLAFADQISDTSRDTLHDVIAQGLAEGWSVDELTRNFGNVFEQWMDGTLTSEDFEWLQARMPDYRREVIARTESLRSLNTGTYELGRKWGVREKEWLATADGRTRDSHMNANGQRRGINEPFTVNGYQMMHPLDMSLGAPLSEVANCRCTTLLHR